MKKTMMVLFFLICSVKGAIANEDLITYEEFKNICVALTAQEFESDDGGFHL